MTGTTQKFGTIVKPTRAKKNSDVNYLTRKDKQMRFNNSRDPIYYIFECVENRPISTLAKEFVKDSLFETINFISKVVG